MRLRFAFLYLIAFWTFAAGSGWAVTAGGQGLSFGDDVYGMDYGPSPLRVLSGPIGGYEFLPLGTINPAYLAGPKESRMGSQAFSEREDGLLWDTTLGGRFGWFRMTSFDGSRAWQVDVEGAAILRLDPENEVDLRSVDFRAGLPISYAWGPNRLKLGYYHLSAHAGDEFLIKNPGFQRQNYVRDALLLGYSRYFGERVRIYGETSWAFFADVSDPWNFQFGYEYAPTRATGVFGEPFFAINALLRQEVDFSGTTTMHAGWAWREGTAGRLLRTGLFFQTGKSHQYEFWNESETQIGVGLWYDF